MTQLRVSVVESHPSLEIFSDGWGRLCDLSQREAPDLLLLNEMPFGPWLAAGPQFDATLWKKSLRAHELGNERLGELGAKVVASSRPFEVAGKRVNQAFVWTESEGIVPVHTKQFFPNEVGFFETEWFQAGERDFRIVSVLDELRLGFLLCTELMFNEYARQYGRASADLVLVPRATGFGGLARWLVAAKMAAVVSGCYVLSSNRSGVNSEGQRFGGRGWIVDPMAELAAQTSEERLLSSAIIDLDTVRKAQRGYPCNVEGPPSDAAQR